MAATNDRNLPGQPVRARTSGQYMVTNNSNGGRPTAVETPKNAHYVQYVRYSRFGIAGGVPVVNVKVSAAEARTRLASLVAGPIQKGQRVVIEKHGKPVAALVSIEDLERLEAVHPTAGRRIGALALVGAWTGVTDKQIDAMLKDIYSERRRDKGRRVEFEH